MADFDIDEDDNNVADAVAGDVHPDELDLYEEDDDDVRSEVNEDTQRLRDMIGKEDDIDDDASDDDEGGVGQTTLDAMAAHAASNAGTSTRNSIKTHYTILSNTSSTNLPYICPVVLSAHVKEGVEFEAIPPNKWSFRMSAEERGRAVASFLHHSSEELTKARRKSEDHIVATRRNRAEAGAQAFRNARVVGATVVGAARRLEAIRAATPFAIVVEEACEVMEPTLMSVLAVQSAQKVELIGDHRQLPAFVQNSWFNLETTMPSIKTSLFERLVTGSVATRGGRQGHRRNETDAEPIDCTILDEQRRMRCNIADITRPDYSDLVNIVDHRLTATQRIGDTILRNPRARGSKAFSQLEAHRQLSSGDPLCVPGILPTIYFWDIPDNNETRARVGLSACNPKEAVAVVALTKWLILCGTPASSISIITPYKGQKTEILSVLRKEKVIPAYRHIAGAHGHGPPPESTVIVSTVDRYQGDENDVVILSLVRTKPGNRFLGNKNKI